MHRLQKSSNPFCAVPLSEHYAIICLLFMMKKTAVALIFLISSISTPIQFIIPQDHLPEPFSTTSNTVEHYNEQYSQSDVPMVIVSDQFWCYQDTFLLVFQMITRETHQNIFSPPFLHNNSGPLYVSGVHMHACCNNPQSTSLGVEDLCSKIYL